MKNHGFVVRSGLTGKSVHVDINASYGEREGQTLIYLAGYGDVIGYTQSLTLSSAIKRWQPVAYAPDGTEVELPAARSRADAIRDVISYLADTKDERLDLQWREVA